MIIVHTTISMTACPQFTLFRYVGRITVLPSPQHCPSGNPKVSNTRFLLGVWQKWEGLSEQIITSAVSPGDLIDLHVAMNLALEAPQGMGVLPSVARHGWYETSMVITWDMHRCMEMRMWYQWKKFQRQHHDMLLWLRLQESLKCFVTWRVFAFQSCPANDDLMTSSECSGRSLHPDQICSACISPLFDESLRALKQPLVGCHHRCNQLVYRGPFHSTVGLPPNIYHLLATPTVSGRFLIFIACRPSNRRIFAVFIYMKIQEKTWRSGWTTSRQVP